MKIWFAMIMCIRNCLHICMQVPHRLPGFTDRILLPDLSNLLLQITNMDLKDNFEHGLPGDESGKSCQLEFGSYCPWSLEHKEVINDSTVKRLKDQLYVARAYYPSIVKLEGKENLSREMKQNIQEHEHMLSEAISDADLPKL
jgi:alpha-1,4-galacturonosyltransferase